MKTILPLILLCIGCASEPKVLRYEGVPTVCPSVTPVVVAPCSDQLKLLESEELAKGFECPANSRTTFPSYYPNNGKVLVLCQCK